MNTLNRELHFVRQVGTKNYMYMVPIGFTGFANARIFTYEDALKAKEAYDKHFSSSAWRHPEVEVVSVQMVLVFNENL